MVRRTTSFVDAPGQLCLSLRPRVRGVCDKGQRPCPYVSCRYHLAIHDVRRDFIRFAFGDAEPHTLKGMHKTCALDVADDGEHSAHDVAALCGLSRQRIAQIEASAARKIQAYYKTLAKQELHLIAPALRAVLCGGKVAPEMQRYADSQSAFQAGRQQDDDNDDNFDSGHDAPLP